MMLATTASSQQIYNIKTSDRADGKMEQSMGNISVTGEVLNGMKTGTCKEMPHFIIQYQE